MKSLGFSTISALAVLLLAPSASATTAYRAHWTLDEPGTPPTAADVSGNGNTGTNFNITGDGSGYTFNGTNSRVVVNNSPSLNPGAATFSWGVTLSMTAPPQPVGETYDVLRKGLSTTAGGDYKFEVKNVNGKAFPRCVSKTYKAGGTKVNALIQGNTNLADGQHHDVTCTKTATGITLKVDALAPRTKTYTGGLGSVSNTSNLALGAKAEATASTGFDWFAGELYDAWVS
jgi:hypothetical protein